MNLIYRIDDHLVELLSGKLKNDCEPADVIDSLAGTPTYSLSAHPRTLNQVEKRVSTTEDLLEEILQPVLADGEEYRLISSRILSWIESALMQYVTDSDETDDQWNEWPAPPEDIFMSYPVSFRYDAAVLTSIIARFGDPSEIYDETIEGVTINLSSQHESLRIMCARAFADIARYSPESASPYLEITISSSLSASTESRRELMMGIVSIVDWADTEDELSVSYNLLAELSKYCIKETSDDAVYNESLRLLHLIAEDDPSACIPAANAISNRLNDPNPEIADRAESILDVLDSADIDLPQSETATEYTLELYHHRKLVQERSTILPTAPPRPSEFGLATDSWGTHQ